MSQNIKQNKKAIVIGASSDIGKALCDDWIEKNWEIIGTFRTNSVIVNSLKKKLKKIILCDLLDTESIDKACDELNKSIFNWDILVLGPGLQEPLELFDQCNFNEWEKSIRVNFTNQLRVLHNLLKTRNTKSFSGPNVLFFAGGGVNSAPVNYSAYTVSKIALIKMVELLSVELPDVKFLIVGPGWVKTKIHNSVLKAGEKAGVSFQRTTQMFQEDNFTAMEKVVECCNTLISGSRSILTGRNYSVAFDRWNEPNFDNFLESNSNLFKLRRFGNNF